MRDSLTVLAILLIGVLTAALVGPYVIDWDSHRALIERRLSEALATPVTVSGPIDVKILPTPRFRFGGITVGAADGHRPRLSAAALEAQLSFTALLRGQVQVMETTWISPRLDVTQAPDGTVDLGLPSNATAERIAIDHLRVRDGTLVAVLADGRRGTIADVDLDGEATSLRGPFKAAGTIGAVPFRLATGALDGGRLRVKLHLDGEGARPGLDFDGTASARPGPVGPAFEGGATLSGVLPVQGSPATIPWTFTAHVTADRDAAVASDVELRGGTDFRALIADGEGRATYAAGDRPPAATIALHGASLDLDRLAVVPDKGAIAPPTGPDLLAVWLRSASQDGTALALPIRLDLSARFDTATLGGQTLLGSRLDLGLDASGTAAVALAVEGPQGSRLALDGTFDPGPARPVQGPFGAAPVAPAPTFRGRAEVRTGDRRRAAAWLDALAPGIGAGLAALPGRSIAASGDVEASLTGVVARNLALTLDGSTFAGLASLTRAVGTEPARLFADLTSDALSLGQMPDLSGVTAAGRDFDLDLALSARAVTLADLAPDRAGGRAVPLAAGHAAFHLTRSHDDLRLDRLAIDLDGAALGGTASRIGTEARADLHVSAPHFGPLAATLGPLLPAEFAALLRTRASALSPMDASVTIEAGAGPEGLLTPRRLALLGTVGATRVDAALVPDGAAGDLAGTLRAESDDGADLLRQLGLPAATVTGPARLVARGRGSPERGFAGHVDAVVGGTTVTVDGRGRTGAGDGRLTLASADLRPVLGDFGAAGAGAGLPAEATGDLGWDGSRLDWRAVSAKIAGTAVSGALSLALPRAGSDGGPTLTGTLSLDRLPGSALLALAFGPQGAAAPGGGWSTAPFGTPPAALPSSTIGLQVGTLPLAAGLEARDVALTLATRGSGVTVTATRGRLGTGTVGGMLALRHDAAGETLSGRADWADVALDAGGLSGRIAGHQDFAATGRSPAALVGGLAGTGSLALTRASLAQTDPTAPGRTLAAITARDVAAERASGGTDVTQTDPEAIRRDLAGRLAAAPLPIGDATVAATLTGGVLRAGPLRIAGPADAVQPWSADTAASLDLEALALTTRTILHGPAAGDVSVVRAGPVDGTPRLSVDATGLVGAVQAQAIARAQERIDVMEQDIRERAAFNRRLKAIQADQQASRERAEAERRAAADAAKAAAEQRRAEAARQKAEDARIQADVAAAARRDRRLDGSPPPGGAPEGTGAGTPPP